MNSLTFVSLSGVDVTLRVGSNTVRSEEQSRLSTTISESVQNFHRLTIDNGDLEILTIGQVNEFLIFIWRESYIPGRALSKGGWVVNVFTHVSTVWAEYLNSVSTTVANIDQTIIRWFGTMYRAAKLLRARFARRISHIGVVIGTITISTPVSFEGTGSNVYNSHSLMGITISEVGFIVCCIDSDFCYSTKVSLAVAVCRLTGHTYRTNVFTITTEYQYVGVRTTITSDPDVTVRCNFDTVVGLRPYIWCTFYGAAPSIDQVTL